jgi:hypothetical protein
MGQAATRSSGGGSKQTVGTRSGKAVSAGKTVQKAVSRQSGTTSGNKVAGKTGGKGLPQGAGSTGQAC